jgi:hypothetical protein
MRQVVESLSIPACWTAPTQASDLRGGEAPVTRGSPARSGQRARRRSWRKVLLNSAAALWLTSDDDRRPARLMHASVAEQLTVLLRAALGGPPPRSTVAPPVCSRPLGRDHEEAQSRVSRIHAVSRRRTLEAAVITAIVLVKAQVDRIPEVAEAIARSTA